MRGSGGALAPPLLRLGGAGSVPENLWRVGSIRLIVWGELRTFEMGMKPVADVAVWMNSISAWIAVDWGGFSVEG